jgi:hypothetical protein
MTRDASPRYLGQHVRHLFLRCARPANGWLQVANAGHGVAYWRSGAGDLHELRACSMPLERRWLAEPGQAGSSKRSRQRAPGDGVGQRLPRRPADAAQRAPLVRHPLGAHLRPRAGDQQRSKTRRAPSGGAWRRTRRAALWPLGSRQAASPPLRTSGVPPAPARVGAAIGDAGSRLAV